MVQLNVDGPNRSALYGASLTLPLPIWNLNEYGRGATSAHLDAASLHYEFRKNSELDVRNRMLDAYQDAVRALAGTPTSDELVEKTRNVEAKFFQGLVASSLVIEAHRSILDLERTRNETEMRALRNLWGIYVIDNRADRETPF